MFLLSLSFYSEKNPKNIRSEVSIPEPVLFEPFEISHYCFKSEEKMRHEYCSCYIERHQVHIRTKFIFLVQNFPSSEISGLILSVFALYPVWMEVDMCSSFQIHIY